MQFRLLIGFFGLILSSQLFAQETSLNDLLNLETRVTVSKMKEELSKSSAADVKVPVLPKLDGALKHIPREPRTIAVYGVSPNYEGQMDFDGSVVTVKPGMTIFGKVVASISANGITLVTPAKRKQNKRYRHIPKKSAHTTSASKAITRFYPVTASGA